MMRYRHSLHAAVSGLIYHHAWTIYMACEEHVSSYSNGMFAGETVEVVMPEAIAVAVETATDVGMHKPQNHYH